MQEPTGKFSNMLYRSARAAGRGMDRVSRVEMIVGAAIVIPLVLYICFVAFARYLFGFTVVGALAYPVFMQFILVSLVISYVLAEDEHVRVRLLLVKLPPRWVNWLNLFALVCFLFFAVVALWASWNSCLWSLETGAMDYPSRQPLIRIKSWMVLGFATLTLQCVVQIVRAIIKIKAR